MTAEVLKQEYAETPITELSLHPRNPNQGDLGVIAESVETNGFYGALLVQKSTGRVLVGNHRLIAARELGIPSLPTLTIDCDDEVALRILTVDNRAARLGIDATDVLSEILVELAMSDTGLTGTGYDGDDLDAMMQDLKDAPDDDAEPRQRKPSIVVECEDVEQAQRLATDLANLHRPLHKVTIQCDTIGERDAMKHSLVELGYQVSIGT